MIVDFPATSDGAICACRWPRSSSSRPRRLLCRRPIKIGLIKIANAGPIYVANERGYFAAEGLDPELVYFEVGVRSAWFLAISILARRR